MSTSNVTIVALIGAGMRTVGEPPRYLPLLSKKWRKCGNDYAGLLLAFLRDSDARKAVNAVHNEFKLGN